MHNTLEQSVLLKKPATATGINLARLRKWLAGIAALTAIPFLFPGYELFLLTSIAISAIVLSGMNILTGYTGLLSLGHGAIYAVGAYCGVLLIEKGGVPILVVPVIAGLICMLLGRAFSVAVLRLEGMQFALATFGLAVVVPQLLRSDLLGKWTGGVQGLSFSRPAPPSMLPLTEDQWMYFVAVSYLVVILVAVARIVKGQTGRALMALRDNPLAASAIGIDVMRYKQNAFAVSALLTGMAGALNAALVQYVAPDSFPFFLSISLFVALVVGGAGALAGPVLGACFLILVPNFAEQISQAATGAVYGLTVIALMAIEKRGIAGIAARLIGWARKIWRNRGG